MSEKIPSPEAVLEALEELGETAEEVAESLRKGGHKGIPKTACACPVANFCNKKFDADTDVQLSEIVLTDCEIVVDMPDNIFQFITRFDNGEFPELVEQT